ncbi:hypothetical protein EC973_008407 [Apophysomyces ossiformis]|uniref:Uncharacterized protein n=1 Tax=Apophysomyces ossiformis TaxID=679940 RepID=A0A8H7BSX3_9FUNG|nr:hypothetical protein EC973_008407 [Apophysomyces ossiformis]
MASVSATPEKALILYSHAPHNLQWNTPAIHDLCHRGCAGQLAMEEQDVQERNRLGNLIQLLGVYGCATAVEVISLASELEIVSVRVETCEQYTQQVKEMLPSVDCLLLDVAGQTEEEAWICIDEIVQSYLDASNILKCVVSPADLLPHKSAWWDELVPRQSCVMKDGQQVTIGKR